MATTSRVFLKEECIAGDGGTHCRCEVCDHGFFLPEGATGVCLRLEVREGSKKECIPVAGFVCPTCAAKSPAELVDDMKQEAESLEEDAIKYRRAAAIMADMKWWPKLVEA